MICFRPIPNPLQGLHLDAQGQYVPVAAHHRTGTRRESPSRSRSAPGICHYVAEYGVGRPTGSTRPASAARTAWRRRSPWVRQLLEAQQESDDVEDIVPLDQNGHRPGGGVFDLHARRATSSACPAAPPSSTLPMPSISAVGKPHDGRPRWTGASCRSAPRSRPVMVIEIITGNTKGPQTGTG